MDRQLGRARVRILQARILRRIIAKCSQTTKTAPYDLVLALHAWFAVFALTDCSGQSSGRRPAKFLMLRTAPKKVASQTRFKLATMATTSADLNWLLVRVSGKRVLLSRPRVLRVANDHSEMQVEH